MRRDDFRLYPRLIGASVRSQMQYKLAFVLRSAADFMLIVSELLPTYFLVRFFGGLEGWTFPQLALLYGMVELSWATVEGGLRGFENFGVYLLQGELDRWLLRPRSIVLQVAAYVFEIRKIGRVLQGAVVLVVAALWLELDLAATAWVAIGILGGIAFFAGIVILSAASQFWTLGQTSELQNMLTYGGSAALTFPVSIYSDWFRRVLVYGIPLAFVNYFPALAALDRVEADGWPAFMPWLSPFVCVGVLLLGQAAFNRGLQRYESTGS